MNEKLVQEAGMVMKTDFWRALMNRIGELRMFVARRYYLDDIKTQEQWVQHAVYQGELRAIDRVLGLPDEVLDKAKGDTR